MPSTLTCCAHSRHEYQQSDADGERMVCKSCGESWTCAEYSELVMEESSAEKMEDDYWEYGRDWPPLTLEAPR